MPKTRKSPPRASRPAAPHLPAPSRARPGHHSPHFALFFNAAKKKKTIGLVVAGIVLVAAAIVLLLLNTELNWSQVTGWIDELNPVAVIPLMALLPVVGFPVVAVYLVAGARFGALGGGVVVAAVTAVHLLLTYAIANSMLRKPLRRFIEKRHFILPAIPEDEHVAVALVAALVPGLPYVVRNYVLALSGVRLRIYFWVCLPVYVARSYVTILLGDLSSDPNRKGLMILVAVDVAKVAICAGVLWWLRRHHRKFHGPETRAPESPMQRGRGAK